MNHSIRRKRIMKVSKKTDTKRIMKVQENIYAVIWNERTITTTRMRSWDIIEEKQKIKEAINILDVIRRIERTERISE